MLLGAILLGSLWAKDQYCTVCAGCKAVKLYNHEARTVLDEDEQRDSYSGAEERHYCARNGVKRRREHEHTSQECQGVNDGTLLLLSVVVSAPLPTYRTLPE